MTGNPQVPAINVSHCQFNRHTWNNSLLVSWQAPQGSEWVKLIQGPKNALITQGWCTSGPATSVQAKLVHGQILLGKLCYGSSYQVIFGGQQHLVHRARPTQFCASWVRAKKPSQVRACMGALSSWGIPPFSSPCLLLPPNTEIWTKDFISPRIR